MPSHADRPALAIMAKRPRNGFTKTRLCPPLTPSQAVELYEAFMLDVLQAASEVPDLQLAVAVTPPDGVDYFESIAPRGALLLPVECATIGRCLDRVLSSLLAMGHPMAAALSSDSPTVSPALIVQALDRLRDVDVVLSPGDDGGYYFIGVKARHPVLFADDIPWSTSEVAARTLARIRDLGLSVDLVAPILDVDTADDLDRLRRELSRLPGDTAPHTRRVLATIDEHES